MSVSTIAEASTPFRQTAGNRAQFFAAAARTIRRVLVDHARGRRDPRDGRPRLAVVYRPMSSSWPGVADNLLELDAALSRLEALDPRRARVVELRFYGGLSAAEAAEATGTSAMAIDSDLQIAKAWLRRDVAAAAVQRTAQLHADALAALPRAHRQALAELCGDHRSA